MVKLTINCIDVITNMKNYSEQSFYLITTNIIIFFPLAVI